jgi:hypothetical protein
MWRKVILVRSYYAAAVCEISDWTKDESGLPQAIKLRRVIFCRFTGMDAKGIFRKK